MNYIDTFTHLYDKGAWFGDTYMEKIADVTEQEAFTQPMNDIHSIAELVAHVIYWRTPLIKKLRGEKTESPSVESPDNWQSLAKLKARGWKGLLEDFAQSQKELLAALKKTKPGFFEGEYSPGNSWDYVTQGIAEHDVYHLGQLALVKKMVRMAH